MLIWCWTVSRFWTSAVC